MISLLLSQQDSKDPLVSSLTSFLEIRTMLFKKHEPQVRMIQLSYYIIWPYHHYLLKTSNVNIFKMFKWFNKNYRQNITVQLRK